MSDNRTAQEATNRVTVVVPVYGDWVSLRDCVQSLIDHADPALFDILIVNDCGPDADALEAGLRGLIFGRSNFRYERNPENLGFVKTCNRAALELDTSGNDILLLNSDTRVTAGALDELRDVLLSSIEHGVACPRSNDATIASIPFHRRDHADRDADRAFEVFTAIRSDLPRFYVAPVAVGFCFLIRRSLIDQYGLFDEVFGKGYNEENDFCLRINAEGYAAVIANHAFVFHVGSTSFGSAQRASLEAKNSAILHQRYPFYPSSVVTFIQNDYAALDRFADLLIPLADALPKKILIDLGNSETDATGGDIVLEALSAMPKGTIGPAEITLVGPGGLSRGELEQFGHRVVDRSALDELFDLGVAIGPVTDPAMLVTLNRHCLRLAVTEARSTPRRYWERRSAEPGGDYTSRLALENGQRIVLSTIASFLADIERLAATVVNRTELDQRDRTIRDMALLWEDEHRRLTAASRQLESIAGSSAYRASKRLSAVASPVLRIVRQS